MKQRPPEPDLSNHYCPICERFGSFGFRLSAGTVYYCGEHKHIGDEAAARLRMAVPPAASGGQGSLL